MYNVLIVCRIPGVLKNLKKYLPSINPEVRIVTTDDIDETLRRLQSDPSIDVVVCEHGKVNAFALHDAICSNIRNHLPFIMVTEKDVIEDAVRAFDDHIDYFIYRHGGGIGYIMELSQKIVLACETNRCKESRELDKKRMNAIITLAGMRDKPFREALNFALETSVDLTSSEIGYLASCSVSKNKLRIIAWSISAMEQCKIVERPMEYELDKAGIWAEPVRLMEPVIINDYKNEKVFAKNGLPLGHVPISNLMMIPIIRNGIPIATAGVGNKQGDYSEDDEIQLRMLIDSLVSIFQEDIVDVEDKPYNNIVRDLLDATECGLVLVDSQMKYRTVNYLASRLLQLPEHTVLNWTLDGSGNNACAAVYTAVSRAIAEKGTATSRFTTETGTGNATYLVSATVTFNSNSTVSSCLATIIDVNSVVSSEGDSENLSNILDKMHLMGLRIQDFIFRNKGKSVVYPADWELLEDIVTLCNENLVANSECITWFPLSEALPSSDSEFNIQMDIGEVKIYGFRSFANVFKSLIACSKDTGTTGATVSTNVYHGDLIIIYTDTYREPECKVSIFSSEMQSSVILSEAYRCGFNVEQDISYNHGIRVFITVPSGKFSID